MCCWQLPLSPDYKPISLKAYIKGENTSLHSKTLSYSQETQIAVSINKLLETQGDSNIT